MAERRPLFLRDDKKFQRFKTGDTHPLSTIPKLGIDKLPNISTGKVLGRSSAFAGAVEELSTNGSGAVMMTNPSTRQITGTSGTIEVADNGFVIECTNAAAVTLTVNSGVTNCLIIQKGAGEITLVAGSGVTLRQRNGLKSAGQYAAVSIIPFYTANELLVAGDTTT